MAFLSLTTSIVAAFGVYALYTLLKLLHQEFASSLRNLPGPKSKNWLLGHRPEILENVRCYGFLFIQFHNLFAVGRSRRTVDLAVWRTLRINTVFGVSMWTLTVQCLESWAVQWALHHRLQGATTHPLEQLSVSETGPEAVCFGSRGWPGCVFLAPTGTNWNIHPLVLVQGS